MKKLKETLFILFQHIVPQHLLSRLVGKIADSTTPWIKNSFIKWFCNNYQINMTEAQEEIATNYPSFNAFFTRALKDDVRPIDQTPGVITSPADGAFSQLGKIEHGRIFQAKGHAYGLTTLLGGDHEIAAPFIDGEFATIYLSPRDYHRVHMPIAGTLTHTTYVPGDLFSVNQTTAAGVEQLFARNERLIAHFETEHGPMAMVLVGAMIVAGIETVWSGQEAPRLKAPEHRSFKNETIPPIKLEKGAEMGRFKLGSTVILLFGKDKISWQTGLDANSPIKLGEAIGSQNSESKNLN
ncbi:MULTISPECIES: archaetidylserine decarboxylase [unclassified Neptuniibacter]|jgi:phosphatidylserine decarboxylase|uniref:archaetidylserine decarboxylase n=1 Tax=unclassified Neptuniibacter TaxID=2630693 RepID=UPI0026E3CCFB|nr:MULTISPECIES: archaetidylserine decarboxylase [unclassified Neptuniibacter]MDO6515095.1 archaetidylserine decarboxylase [Neptuniibacter sp. 2_MG-2023]MDO6594849.1 archaetidylserine decarboxylase [Neptuniibacter sp. 1_MG-2023]